MVAGSRGNPGSARFSHGVHLSMDWMIHAACRGLSKAQRNRVFFREEFRYEVLTADAAQMCRDCPVRAECLDYALESGPAVVGIWAGTTSEMRRKLRRARQAS